MEKHGFITKKEFKEQCNCHVYTGYNGGKIRINALFFDFKQGTTEDGKFFAGYKYMVYSNVRNITKKDLLNRFYEWVIEQVHPAYYINYKYAETDLKRFKPGLSLQTN
jgi:hypothetical protein